MVEKLDLDRSEQRVMSAVDFVLTQMPELGGMRDKACARVRFTLGLLHYAQRQMGAARRYLLQATKYDPGMVSEQQLWSTFAKSLVAFGAHNVYVYPNWKITVDF